MASTAITQLGINLATLRTHQPKQAPHEDNLEVKQTSTDFAVAWTETFERKASDVLANKRLSNVGQQEEIRKVAEAGMGDLGPLRRPIETTRDAMGRFRAISLDYMELPEGQDKLEALLLAQEIRLEFRGRSQHERDAAFIAAAQKLDRTTMRSFMTAPAGPWITGEVLQRAEQAYGERRDSGAWERVQRLGQLFDHLVSLGRMIAMTLLSYNLELAKVEKALGLTLAEMDIAEPPKPLAQLITGQGADCG